MALLLGDLAGRQNKNNQNNFMTWTILQELCAMLKTTDDHKFLFVAGSIALFTKASEIHAHVYPNLRITLDALNLNIHAFCIVDALNLLSNMEVEK